MSLETSGKLSGAALILGAVGGIATMAIHPTGVHLGDAAEMARQADMTRLAHGVALASMPLLLFGLADYSRRADLNRASSLAGLVFYAFATVAVMSAALMSGMIMGSLIDAWPETLLTERPGLNQLMDYTHTVNQAYAAVFALASAAAVVAWSLGLLGMGRRVMGWLGIAVGIGGAVFVFVGGHDALSVHGFLLLMLGEGVWLIGLGLMLWSGWRAEPAPAG